MLLDGNIVLCGRSDPAVNRSFDGALASLSLYDVALDSTEIEAIYDQASQCWLMMMPNSDENFISMFI